MYPQINLAGGFTNPSGSPTGTSSFGSPGSPTEPSTTLLRVVVAEKFRVAPPVPVPAAATAPAQQQQQPPTAADTATNAIDFSYEKNILKELESSSFIQDIASNGDSQQLGQSSNRTEALISQCIAAGYERKEASLALAAALSTAGDRIDGSIVAQSARDLKHLTSMGFTGGDAVGALVANRGDLQAAIDMLT